MPEKKKNKHAIALGKLGGKKGGPARAAKLTPAEQSAHGKKASTARWQKYRLAQSRPKDTP